jgi:hypothetical protein
MELIKLDWLNEPCHDKTNIVRLRPAWIQTSLRIRAVWSGSMLFAIGFSTCKRVCKGTAWILISWSGSMLVANQLCWFCRVTAQWLWTLSTLTGKRDDYHMIMVALVHYFHPSYFSFFSLSKNKFIIPGRYFLCIAILSSYIHTSGGEICIALRYNFIYCKL